MKILVTGGTGMVGSAFKNIETKHESAELNFLNPAIEIEKYIKNNGEGLKRRQVNKSETMGINKWNGVRVD